MTNYLSKYIIVLITVWVLGIKNKFSRERCEWQNVKKWKPWDNIMYLHANQQVWFNLRLSKEVSALSNTSGLEVLIKWGIYSEISFRKEHHPQLGQYGKNVKKYQTYGTSHNRNKENSGLPRTARTEENIQVVREDFENNRKISCRRNELNISKSTFNRVTDFCTFLYIFENMVFFFKPLMRSSKWAADGANSLFR